MVYYLPNLDIAERVPTNWDAFWDQANFMLELVRSDLEKDLQTHDQARHDPARQQRDDVIRFRKSDDQDQIAYFHDLGRRSLDLVEDLIERREWTPVLAHHWSILMFAHGFVMPSAFALDNDLNSERAGAASRAKNSREPHRRWFAHYCLRAYERHRNQGAAEGEVETLLRAILDGKMPALGGFTLDWFKMMVSYPEDPKTKVKGTTPQLTYLFRSKRLSLGQMRELAKLPTNDLPPLNLSIPHP